MELNQTLELGHIDSNFIIPWKKSYDSKKITLVESWEFALYQGSIWSQNAASVKTSFSLLSPLPKPQADP